MVDFLSVLWALTELEIAAPRNSPTETSPQLLRSRQFRAFKIHFKNNLFPGGVYTHVTIGPFFPFLALHSTISQNSRFEEFSTYTNLSINLDDLVILGRGCCLSVWLESLVWVSQSSVLWGQKTFLTMGNFKTSHTHSFGYETRRSQPELCQARIRTPGRPEAHLSRTALPGVLGLLADHTLKTLSSSIELFIWPSPGSGYMRDTSLSGRGSSSRIKILCCL